MLIVNIANRRSWVICLPIERAAFKDLQTWKDIIEHQSGEKIKSARSDSAPELLKSLRVWSEKTGVQNESTKIA